MRIFTACAGCGHEMPYEGEQRTTRHQECPDPNQAIWTLTDQFLAAAEADDNDRANRLAAQLDAINNRPPRLLDAALAYASWGWAVFPCRPGEKTPATRNGYKDATTDPAQIHTWWRHNPHANIGIPTGDTFDVLDVDLEHGVWREWLDLQNSTNMPDAHGIALTPSGGLHVLLEPTGVGNGTQLGGRVGFDFRGRGGHIIVAPSVLNNGHRYSWWVKPSPTVQRTTLVEVAA